MSRYYAYRCNLDQNRCPAPKRWDSWTFLREKGRKDVEAGLSNRPFITWAAASEKEERGSQKENHRGRLALPCLLVVFVCNTGTLFFSCRSQICVQSSLDEQHLVEVRIGDVIQVDGQRFCALEEERHS